MMSSGRLEQLYQRAQKLSKVERNYDYAHELLAQCIVLAPSSDVYADAMLTNLRAKFAESTKKSARFFGRGQSLKKALQNQDWSAILQQGAELLKANPWDVATLRAMATACEARHCNEAELVYLKQALDAEPKGVEVNRHCAQSLGRMGQFDQAIACWHRVEKLVGKDAEATRMISQLAEEKLKYPGGIPLAAVVARPEAEKKIPPAAAAATTEVSVESLLTPRQLLQRSLAENPQDEASHLGLAEMLIADEQYGVAEACLRRAIAACGESPALLEKLENVQGFQRQPATLKSREPEPEPETLRVPWLELAFAAAVVGLGLQLVPAAGQAAWQVVDVPHWSRLEWFLLNVGIIGLLLCVRFAPNLSAVRQDLRNWRRSKGRPAKR